jgi:TPR repeat protein
MNPFFEGLLRTIGQKAAEAVAGAVSHKSRPNDDMNGKLSSGELLELLKRGLIAHNDGDDYLAVQYYTAGAQNGHATCQFFLGMSLYNGKGCAQNTEEGFKWVKAAAQQGDEDAINWLSIRARTQK